MRSIKALSVRLDKLDDEKESSQLACPERQKQIAAELVAEAGESGFSEVERIIPRFKNVRTLWRSLKPMKPDLHHWNKVIVNHRGSIWCGDYPKVSRKGLNVI